MNGPEPKGERSIALFLLGILLFNPPMLAIFGAGDDLGGVPLIYIYLFAAWALFILLMGVIAEVGEERRHDRRVPQLPGEAEEHATVAVRRETLPHSIDPGDALPGAAVGGGAIPADADSGAATKRPGASGSGRGEPPC